MSRPQRRRQRVRWRRVLVGSAALATLAVAPSAAAASTGRSEPEGPALRLVKARVIPQGLRLHASGPVPVVLLDAGPIRLEVTVRNRGTHAWSGSVHVRIRLPARTPQRVLEVAELSAGRTMMLQTTAFDRLPRQTPARIEVLARPADGPNASTLVPLGSFQVFLGRGG